MAVFGHIKGIICQAGLAIIFIAYNQPDRDKFTMALQAKNKAAKILAPEFFPCVNRHTLPAFQPLINMENDSVIRAANQIDKTDEPPLSFEIEKGTSVQLIYQSLSLRMFSHIHHFVFSQPLCLYSSRLPDC